MGSEDFSASTPLTLEENLKKAMTEVLVLHLLSERERYIGELASLIHERSGGRMAIVFPYSAIYRLEQSGYLVECGKRTAPDGRRRQYYQITDTGRSYLKQLLDIYSRFTTGIANILDAEGAQHERSN